MLRLLLTFAIVSTFGRAVAQEFWMESRKFLCRKGELVGISFMASENFIDDKKAIDQGDLIALDHHSLAGVSSLMDKLLDGSTDALRITFAQDGTHLFSFQTGRKPVPWEGEAFDNYLQANGLEQALDQRIRSGIEASNTVEHVTQHGKLLIHVGDVSGSMFRKVTGHLLEIIPVNNPYLAGPGEELKFRILYEGDPLPYSLVRVWNRKQDRVFVQRIYTEKDGTMTTRLSNDGIWMVSVVQINEMGTSGEWVSNRCTLVFGFE